MQAIDLIRERVRWCESEGVEILCCPEAVLGGLADYAARPENFALDVDSGQLAAVLSPLASDTVTTIIGFTEMDRARRLYNSAAIFHRGAVIGVYRKVHPAIRGSVYQPGDQIPVFTIGGLTFGILICNDSNFPELARAMAARGASALFIPTNNGLPPEKAEVADDARRVDVALARENRAWVIRADVAGRAGGLVSLGSSAIADPDGVVVQSGRRLSEDLLIAPLIPDLPRPHG